MALRDDILALRVRTTRRLVAAHDYYADTQTAWNIVNRVVNAGERFSDTNPVTGTVTDQNQLVDKSREYTTRHIAHATFQQFLSIFEDFLFDLLRLWLTAYPGNLKKKALTYQDVLDATDLAAVTQLVIGRELNDVKYRRPADWFAYLEERAKTGCPAADEIARFAEAKATRDALVHGDGFVTVLYEQKVPAAYRRFAVGDEIEIPEPYHRELWLLTLKLTADVCDAVVLKA